MLQASPEHRAHFAFVGLTYASLLSLFSWAAKPLYAHFDTGIETTAGDGARMCAPRHSGHHAEAPLILGCMNGPTSLGP